MKRACDGGQSKSCIDLADLYDGGTFPPVAAKSFVGSAVPTTAAPIRFYNGIEKVRLYMLTARAGSGTTLISHWHRCKLEYKP